MMTVGVWRVDNWSGDGSGGNNWSVGNNWGSSGVVGGVAWVDIGMLSDGWNVDLSWDRPVSSSESRLWDVCGRGIGWGIRQWGSVEV